MKGGVGAALLALAAVSTAPLLQAASQATIGPLQATRITTGVPIDPTKSPVNKPICVSHAWADDKLLVSANYPNGQPYSFYVVEQDGGLTPWGDTNGLTNEIMLDTVPTNNRAGYIPGDLFTGNGADGQVLRLTNSGQTRIQSWCNLVAKTAGQAGAPSSAGLLRGALHFDRHGSFNYELVVATTRGHVYRVQAGLQQCGDVTYLGTAGVHLEGMTVLPPSPQWGRFGGAAIIGAEQQGDAWAFWPDGRKERIAGIGARIEDLDEVPFDERDTYYIVNYGANALFAVDYTQFAGHGGKVMVTQERSAFFELQYNAALDTLRCYPVTINGYAAGSTEQATFSLSGVNEILPADFSLCINASSPASAGVATSIKPVHLDTVGTTAVSNYLYTQQTPRSAQAAMMARPNSGELAVFFTQDWRNQFTLHVMTGTMPAAANFDVRITTRSGAATDPLGSSVRLLVQDDPDDSMSLNVAAGSVVATLDVASGETDGLVVGPIDFVPMQSLIDLEVEITVNSGSFTGGMNVISQATRGGPLSRTAFSGTLTLARVHCNCGDGLIDRAEQCDPAAPNSTICCTPQCTFASPTTECRPAQSLCDQPETCTGSSAVCPPDVVTPATPAVQCGYNGANCSYCDGVNPTCPPVATAPAACPTGCTANCSNHGACLTASGVPTCSCTTGVANPYTGVTCNIPACSSLLDCGSCSAHPECGWCCSSTGGYCTAGSSAGPADPTLALGGSCPNYQYDECACAAPCQNGGTCGCGQCICVPPYGGPDCSQIVDCNGTVGGTAVFGVCGCDRGDTECIGCDGLPFGKQLDACGVCGGDGSSCYNPCPAADCGECGETPECIWCRKDGEDLCVQETEEDTCELVGEDPTTCALFEEEAAVVAGLAAGAVVGIIIGIVACVLLAGGGAAAGIQYLNGRENVQGVQQSPLYEDDGMRGHNPLHDQESSGSFLKPGATTKAEHQDF